MHRLPGLERSLWRDEIRATLALAWPLILTNLVQNLINATDVLLLGWAGARTLAAGTLGINLYMACFIFGIGVITGAAPIMAREIGARSYSVREVRLTVRQAMWCAAAITVPAWLVLWNAKAILIAIGQEPALAEGAQQMVRALQWGLLPALLYLVLRTFVATLERPIWALIVVAAAVLFNAVVNYALIFGKFGLPRLGLLGAGIGSSLANLFLFIGMAMVIGFHPRFRRYHLLGRFWQPDWARFRRIWSLGLPIGVTLALESWIFNAALMLIGLFGAASIAAHSVAIQLAALAFMIPLGIGQAATVRVGLAYGRRDRAAIGRAGWTALVLALGFMVLTAMMMLVLPRELIGLFLDPRDPANSGVFSLAVSFLFVAALFQIVDGAQVVGAGMLRGLHDTRVPMVYAAFGYWVVGLATGVGFAFGLGWRGLGIWVGLAVGLGVVAVLMIVRWMRREQLGLVPLG
jgi:MATE family multidrug resistance protein